MQNSSAGYVLSVTATSKGKSKVSCTINIYFDFFMTKLYRTHTSIGHYSRFLAGGAWTSDTGNGIGNGLLRFVDNDVDGYVRKRRCKCYCWIEN